MPRDISGVYTLPASMPVQPRTIPVTNVFNTVLADVRGALNNIPSGALEPWLKPEHVSIMGETTGPDAGYAILDLGGTGVGSRTGYLAKTPSGDIHLINETGELQLGTAINSVTLFPDSNTIRIGADVALVPNTLWVGTYPEGVPEGDANHKIELGNMVPSNGGTIPHIDFHSGDVPCDFDVRVAAHGGTGSEGGGALALYGTPVSLEKGQLRFPATQLPSADPNTLDDYEEGSWTPTFVLDGGNNAGLSISSYDMQYGRYVKIGRQVWFWFSMSCIAIHTDSYSWAGVAGLPFTVSAILPYYPVAGYCENYYNVGVSLYGSAQGLAVNSTNLITLYVQGAGPTSNIGTTYMRHNSGTQVYVHMSGSYICDN